ncbi:MAG: thiosulfate sulfurtransferase [Candidatus Contendobacter odensis]|uniref:Thiosulfate sulfurtransferase n=1 Tax=Candidatus Contendibacter odensensis TaxID=1400860 RepID=A0A2G6PHC2_9GAMM|nr:MAG: thiosulfate sulfurtransferase [Candidatus Contendobacter odensis]
MTDLTPLIETEQLQMHLDNPNVLVVDLSNPATYTAGHIVGAVHLDYAHLVRAEPPATGLLPTGTQIGRTLSRIGLKPEQHVVAYDDEGNGRASRLLWTLAVLGHTQASLLNGGRLAWQTAGGSLETRLHQPAPSHYPARFSHLSALADRDYIIKRLGQSDVVLLDTRSPAEYSGQDQRAAHSGHIPGAINLNWTDTMNPQQQLRYLPDPALQTLLDSRGVTPDKEIIVYCQTHHRSAHTYWLLHHLGYPRIRGYVGAWSEWGNDPDLPRSAASPAL